MIPFVKDILQLFRTAAVFAARGGTSLGILSELNMVKTALGGHFNNKAKFTIEGCMLPIYVQFNPESYSVRESVQYNEIRGNVPFRRVVQFVGSVQSITSLSFRFDTNSVITSSGSGAMMGPMAAVGGAVMSAADSVMSFAISIYPSRVLGISVYPHCSRRSLL